MPSCLIAATIYVDKNWFSDLLLFLSYISTSVSGLSEQIKLQEKVYRIVPSSLWNTYPLF